MLATHSRVIGPLFGGFFERIFPIFPIVFIVIIVNNKNVFIVVVSQQNFMQQNAHV